jgi:hypothetical protein
MERRNSGARVGEHADAVDDQTVRWLADSSALLLAYSLKISARQPTDRGERSKPSGKKGAMPAFR